MVNNQSLINDASNESISITHRHILASLNTLIKNEKTLQSLETIRILDAGCGDGKLIFYLNKFLPLFNDGKKIDVYGYDVADHGVQQADYMNKTFSFLHENNPDINWNDRIKLINSKDEWPFEDGSFDIVLSNQVLEHVWDHDFFFKENNRVLAFKGFSIHIFPVKEVMIDWHVFLPGVHQLKSWDAIYHKIKFYTKLGFGVYKKDKQQYNNSIHQFSRVWADKIYHYCNYQTYEELSKVIKKNNLCFTTRFTYDFYRKKVMELAGAKGEFFYKNRGSSKVWFFFLKRISGVSIVLYKGEYSSY